MLLGEICQEEKAHVAGPLPQGVSGLGHYLGIQVLGSCTEETSSLAHREMCWDRQKGWSSLDFTCEECTHVQTCLQSGQREPWPGGCRLTTCPSMKGQTTCPLHTTAWRVIWAKIESRHRLGSLQCEPGRITETTISLHSGVTGATMTEQQLSSKSWELSSQGAKEPEEHTGVVSQREHPGSIHFTLWLSTRSREKSATGAALR